MTNLVHTARSVSEGYNGWSNYETWATNLWLSGDEGSYRLLLEAVALPFMENWERAEWLKGELSFAMTDVIDGPCLWQDLLAHAFDRVDWLEIIEGNQEEGR